MNNNNYSDYILDHLYFKDYMIANLIVRDNTIEDIAEIIKYDKNDLLKELYVIQNKINECILSIEMKGICNNQILQKLISSYGDEETLLATINTMKPLMKFIILSNIISKTPLKEIKNSLNVSKALISRLYHETNRILSIDY